MTGTQSTVDLQQRWSTSLMDNYGVPRVALVRGEGAVVTDADGKQYLDLLAGIAVNILGHAHPAVIEAVTAQLSTLGHTSNLYATEPGIELRANWPSNCSHIWVRVRRDECSSATRVPRPTRRRSRSRV